VPGNGGSLGVEGYFNDEDDLTDEDGFKSPGRPA
jgi:hypothetical protein